MQLPQVTMPANIISRIAIGIAVVILLALLWPFYSVPTGSRGVITQFGKIVGIEGEGLAILPPWQKLSNFSIRAEKADIENAEGSTSDTQPVKVSMTVRYSIATDRVSEVFEKYSHDGNLASYVQTATQEIFKAVTAKYTAPDLIAQRAKVSADINAAPFRVNTARSTAATINNISHFVFMSVHLRTLSRRTVFKFCPGAFPSSVSATFDAIVREIVPAAGTLCRLYTA